VGDLIKNKFEPYNITPIPAKSKESL